MNDIWNKFSENPWVSVVLIVCGTILGCAIVFGGVCCQQAEFDYRYKLRQLETENSKNFWNNGR